MSGPRPRHVHTKRPRKGRAPEWPGERGLPWQPATMGMLAGRRQSLRSACRCARAVDGSRARAPARYSPACHTEGTFGIVEGPETLVKLELLNAETAALLASRRLHPTQRFEKRADGTAVLNSGTPDLQSSQLF